MGRGTWYYSLGVFLAIVDAFVRSEFEISLWRGARVDVRTYLLGGAIDGSEANGIIRNPKLELESSRFTFDLVPLSYESVDVIVGENWLLRHKAEMVHSHSQSRSGGYFGHFALTNRIIFALRLPRMTAYSIHRNDTRSATVSPSDGSRRHLNCTEY
ncbi:hypothetical protein Tco_0411979 [Tanacetum coccineum]